MNFLRIVNILSLDVAIGTVVGSVFFSKLCNIPLFPIELVVLFITVWIIYTTDHLLDVIRLNRSASSLRHQYHQRNFKLLFRLTKLAFITVLVMVYFMSQRVLLLGGLLALLTLFYVLVQNRLRGLKELFGAALYMSGILLLPLSHLTKSLSFDVVVMIFQFSTIVLLNLYLFAWYDKDGDQQDGHYSFAVNFGSKVTEKLLIGLFALEGILLFVQWIWTPATNNVTFLFVTMTSLLLFLFVKRTYWKINERYRFLGDTVFLIPIIYVIMANAQRF